jgi:ribonuclease P/MRP protein subunit RPP40
MQPSIEALGSVSVPHFPETVEQDDTETAVEILEWLSLVASSSPRIQQDDQIDSYLSQYRVPSGQDILLDETEDRQAQDLVKFHWHGLIPPRFLSRVLSTTLKACGSSWFAFSASAFDETAYAFLQNKHHTMTWEYSD